MTKKNLLWALFALPFFGCTQVKSQTEIKQTAIVHPTVIELFTSEGCSSCPPADVLVAKIKEEYKNKPVYILAYHVDYWDRLGWKDAFSDAAYSKRQYKYANWFNKNGVYTPQIVVNGNAEFVGSNAARLRSELVKSSSVTDADINMVVSKQGNDKVSISYKLSDVDKANAVNFALVEENAVTDVKRGENSNRMLHHVNIVRELKTLDGSQNGSVVFKLPTDLSQNYHIVAFLQNNKTGKITSAISN